ncbi:MAG: alpha-L-fucosidase [Chitinophagaceae bacterium]
MKLLQRYLWLLLLCALATPDLTAQVITPARSPNATQTAMLSRGYGMFIHFGINTFADIEWSDGTIPAEKYAPSELDPDQWVRVAKQAGFRYVLLTVKHHDGFCLWDSKYTTYDIASSPVKTDVVKAVADACRRYGVQFAIYYSLWDRHEPVYKDHAAYKKFMLDQLRELFTAYGPVCELWLDGGWDKKPEEWGIEEIYRLAKKYNPDCAVSVNHTIVNEEGKRNYTPAGNMTQDDKFHFQYFPSDFRLWDPQLANLSDRKQYLHKGGSYYLPFEHTICLSKRWNWFQKSAELPVRDLNELQELFYWATANKNTLVLNVPPDHTGRIREYEANAVIGLGKRLGIQAGKPLPVNGTFLSTGRAAAASSIYPDATDQYAATAVNDGNMQSRWAAADTLAEVMISLDETKPFNKISIFEYQDVKDDPDGFSQYRTPRIRQYAIDLMLGKKWTTVYLGEEPVGDCRVIYFPVAYKTSRLRLRVLKATAPPSIYEMNVIYMNDKKQ